MCSQTDQHQDIISFLKVYPESLLLLSLVEVVCKCALDDTNGADDGQTCRGALPVQTALLVQAPGAEAQEGTETDNGDQVAHHGHLCCGGVVRLQDFKLLRQPVVGALGLGLGFAGLFGGLVLGLAGGLLHLLLGVLGCAGGLGLLAVEFASEILGFALDRVNQFLCVGGSDRLDIRRVNIGE